MRRACALAVLLVLPLAAGGQGAVRAVLTFGPGMEPDLAGARVLHRYAAFPGALVEAPPAVLADLARSGLRVDPDVPLEAHLDLAGAVLGLRGDGAPEETGRGVTVAVVDAGIDPTHPGIQGRIDAFALTPAGWQPSAASQDPQGHGTRVVGVLAGDGAQSPDARYRGVAPGARVVGLDLGQQFTLDGALQAFDWLHAHARERGIRAVSNSWGMPGPVDGRFDAGAPLVKASDALADDGVLVVFSAGNRGGQGTISTNALNPRVLTVGATDAGGQLAPFSSQGPGLDAAGKPLAWRKPDLVAVGQGVVSARSGTGEGDAEDRSLAPPFYGEASGTSLAAPMVAGTAALLLQADPGLTAAQLADVLRATARDLGPPGPDDATGAGLLDPRAALLLAREHALAARTARQDASVSFPADVVALAGVMTRVSPGPGVQVGGDLVGYVPVLPGSPGVHAEVSWQGGLGATFTARLQGPRGESVPLAGSGGALRADVDAPSAGVWEVRATPGPGFFQARVTLAGTAHLVRDWPGIASLDALERTSAPGPAPQRAPGFDAWLALAGCIAALAVARRR